MTEEENTTNFSHDQNVLNRLDSLMKDIEELFTNLLFFDGGTGLYCYEIALNKMNVVSSLLKPKLEKPEIEEVNKLKKFAQAFSSVHKEIIHRHFDGKETRIELDREKWKRLQGILDAYLYVLHELQSKYYSVGTENQGGED